MSDQKWEPTIGSRVALLEADLAQSRSPHAELPIEGARVSTSVGLDHDGGLWLRITCDPRSVATDDHSAAISFTVTPSGYRVRVAPSAERAVAVHFLDDIVELLSDGHQPGDAGRTALQRWRELLAKPAGKLLSDEHLVGLIGELEVLEMVLRQGGNLDYWTGWMKDHEDFRLPGLTIEVKSTTSANYRRVQIHGLHQLADPQDGSELLLVLRRLERSPQGRSVPDLTDDIVGLGASRSMLLEHLSETGYSEVHRTLYQEFRFVSQELAIRRVDDTHPRLTPETLAGVDLSGIDKIDYELNLNDRSDTDLTVDLEEHLKAHLDAQ